MADDRRGSAAVSVDPMDVEENESEYGDDDLTAADFEALEKDALATLAKEHDSLVKTVTEGLTEKLSTFSSHDLDRVLQKEMNIATPEKRAELVEKIVEHANVVGLKETADGAVTRYTTRVVLAEERQILDDADALSEARDHRLGNDQRAGLSQKYGLLNGEQRRAVAHLTGEGGFAMLKGEAGTGKTKVLSVVREGYAAAGRRVLALSFTNDVVQDLRKAGFDHANTVDGELGSLKNGAADWKDKPVVVVDEAAMLSTNHLSGLLHEARKAGAKVIVAGDDRQLPSIKRGGMFGSLSDFHGGAELHEVLRVKDAGQKRAFNHMHKGEFKQALAIFDEQKAIRWCKSRDQARQELVKAWAADAKAQPEKTRAVFAYTNNEVKQLNAELREVYREQGRLGDDHELPTAYGKIVVAKGDRLNFTRTDKNRGFYNGQYATVQSIIGAELTIREDGASKDRVFNAAAFTYFRHGYAGTVHRGQGKTVDQAYILPSKRWNDRLSYVGMTRHCDRPTVFTTAKNLDSLAAQMGRLDECPSASKFHVDMDKALVKGMSNLKVRDGLPGQIAGRKRGLADVNERDGGSIFGQEPSSLAADAPKKRVKRLKIHHPSLPDADVATRQSTGAASRMNGAHPTENTLSTAHAAAGVGARMARPSANKNLHPRRRGRGGDSYGR